MLNKMKPHLSLFAFSSIILFFLMGATAVPGFAQPEDETEGRIRFDRNHSTLGFAVPIAGGISRVTGKFTDFSVDLIWDDLDPSKSSVSLEIQVASLATGLDGRNRDVLSDRVLNVEAYPTIIFHSSDIRRNGTDYVAIGDFTLHGVTKEIYLPIRVVTVADEEDPDDLWRAFHIGYELDRRDYGIDWKHRSVDFFFGYDIKINIMLLER